MRPIFGKKSPMSSVTALTKSAAQALIEREERRTGSRMVAYVNVAASVGASWEWLRKFVSPSSHEAKRPDIEVGFNILALCDRLDESTQRIADENAALRKQIHAVTPRILSERLAADSQDMPANPAVLRTKK